MADRRDAAERGGGGLSGGARAEGGEGAAVLSAEGLAGVAGLPAPAAFLERCAAYGVEFEGTELATLGRYLAMLLRANTVHNLTSVTDPDEAWTRHVFDSLTLLPLLGEPADGSTLVDVGSGGGLPGMVLAVVLPRVRVTLLEATGKKVEFLRAAAGALGLSNVEVVADRAERFAHDRGEKVSEGGRSRRERARRETFDFATARAVGRVATLAELVVPLIRIGGRALLVKGAQADAEVLEAAGALHLLKAVHAGTIETPTGRVVVLEKHAATPRDYPRADGEPKRAPLGVRTGASRERGR